MMILIIAGHVVAAVMMAMIFEWIWTQEFVKKQDKWTTCRAYWMFMCVVSVIVGSNATLLLVPIMIVIGFTQVHLIRTEPGTTIEPMKLLKHIPNVIRATFRRFVNK